MCRRLLPPLVVLFLLATACGGEATPGSAGSPGAVDATGGGDLQTVAAVYPLAWVAGQIAPDAEVNLLNEGGQEAHDLDISPPQRAAIETADVVLYMGDIDYQPQVEDAIPAAPGEVVSAAEVAGDDALLGGDCAFDEAIVSHAAYAYLLQPYGKTQHAVTNVSAEGDASAGELAEIVGEIREEGFTHVLAEPVEGREGAEAVANEAGVELLEISPLDAVTEEQAAAGLPDLVRAQAETFATALGCA